MTQAHGASTIGGVGRRQEADEIHNKRLEHLCSRPEEANGRAEPLEIQRDHQTDSAQALPA